LSPVTDDYIAPYPFTGEIDSVTFAIRSKADAADVRSIAQTELAKE